MDEKKRKFIFVNPTVYNELVDGWNNYDEIIIDTPYLAFDKKLVIKTESIKMRNRRKLGGNDVQSG